MRKRILFFTCFALLMFLETSEGKVAGLVVAVRGKVELVDYKGEKKRLMLKDKLFTEDTIKTGPRGRVQICFEDNSLVSLGKNTVLKISDFEFTDHKKIMNLKVDKGIFRVLGGKIAKLAPENFKTQTPTATVGIRGSMFAGQFFDDKLEAVFLGGKGITITNEFGMVEINKPSMWATATSFSKPSDPVPVPNDIISRLLEGTSASAIQELILEVPEDEETPVDQIQIPDAKGDDAFQYEDDFVGELDAFFTEVSEMSDEEFFEMEEFLSEELSEEEMESFYDEYYAWEEEFYDDDYFWEYVFFLEGYTTGMLYFEGHPYIYQSNDYAFYVALDFLYEEIWGGMDLNLANNGFDEYGDTLDSLTVLGNSEDSLSSIPTEIFADFDKPFDEEDMSVHNTEIIADALDLGFGWGYLYEFEEQYQPEYSRWGTWEIEFENPLDPGSMIPMYGVWTVGELTPLEDIEGIIYGDYNFVGTYEGLANCIKNNIEEFSGSASLSLDFGLQEWIGNVDLISDQENPLHMDMSGNLDDLGFYGSVDTVNSDHSILNSNVKGTYYGPYIQEAGGIFHAIDNSNNGYIGGFVAEQTDLIGEER